MKGFCMFLILIELITKLNQIQNISEYNKENKLFIGIYRINSISNNKHFKIKNNHLLLSDFELTYFRLIHIENNLYYIESSYNTRRLGVNNNNKIIIYSKKQFFENQKIIWKLIKINNSEYLIQNTYNQKYIEQNNNILLCSHNYSYFSYSNLNNIQININFIFHFLKLFEEGIIRGKYFKYINSEPIDIVIKYIDLTDKQLNRKGINQIYKDFDNEELKYSIRSILENIPWIRNIYILMPNKKVKFLKSIEYISDKILYINDKDFLGYDSANIFAFTFNLYKLEKFGVSKNFIYMEDDFFIGNKLKKYDFFYYDESLKKVLPFILNFHFYELNRYYILQEYEKFFKIKDSIIPQSREAWWFSEYITEIFFLENLQIYNINKSGMIEFKQKEANKSLEQTVISANFTHNAIPENLDDLKEVYNSIQNYKYINETLFSNERNILTLNQPHFVVLFQLNIKHKKVHSIPYRYIEIEKINKIKLNYKLFVINTGGNHKPTNRHYKLQKKIMEKRFPFQSKYEINKKCIYDLIYINNYILILKFFIILNFIKLYNN